MQNSVPQGVNSYIVDGESTITREVISNLLNVHKRLCDSGKACDVIPIIKISKFLFKLAKNYGQIFNEVITEEYTD